MYIIPILCRSALDWGWKVSPRFWKDYDPERQAMSYRAAMALMLGELMTGVGRPYQ